MDESEFVLRLLIDFSISGVDPSDSTTRMASVIYSHIRDNLYFCLQCNRAQLTVLAVRLVLLLL
jgi:hypothetical protein